MATTRPNILYIFTDQQSADAMSCTGNPHLRTPAMDRLAASGVRFDTACSAYPLCVPARMAMFTGRMPHELGVYANVHETDAPCPAPLLGRWLGEAGYRCHYIGKWHLTVGQDRTAEHGFGEVVFGGSFGGQDTDKAEAARAFLANPPAEPFFLTVSLNNPHDACQLSRGEQLPMGPIGDPPADDQLPPAPANLQPPEDQPAALRRFAAEEGNIFRAPGWDEREIRRYRWGYNRLVEMVDAEIAKVLDALEQSGLWDRTLIVFSSDHGDGQGAHRWNQKWCHYDEVVRVPFVVVAPGGRRAGQVEAQPVSASLDLLPTLCDYAGIAPPPAQRGRSVRDLLESPGGGRGYVASEVGFATWSPLHEKPPAAGRMIRTERYKYIAYQNPAAEQLFDMHADPGELANLAADPALASTLADHRRHLQDWCRLTDDDFAVPGL